MKSHAPGIPSPLPCSESPACFFHTESPGRLQSQAAVIDTGWSLMPKNIRALSLMGMQSICTFQTFHVISHCQQQKLKSFFFYYL
jgi:hypothetical protein